jgi:hypothetical protein
VGNVVFKLRATDDLLPLSSLLPPLFSSDYTLYLLLSTYLRDDYKHIITKIDEDDESHPFFPLPKRMCVCAYPPGHDDSIYA